MSVSLPRALRPWAEPLELFGEVVHDGIGRWLHPLRALLGPLTIPSSAASGDPDGTAGLHRRGPYERLLLSEWAVALELPDEFLRRAADAEHMFVAPAYREPKASHGSVALLDCGPRQLGSPRLAHLAALVVLQQRAEAGSATFQFGVLQDEQRRLGPLETVAVPRWLRQRTMQTATVHLDAWRAALDEHDAPDRWLVGGPDLREVAVRLGAGLLEVQETREGEARSLRVAVRRPKHGTSGGEIVLPMPPDEDCVRILRAPLAPRRPPPRDGDARLRTDQLGQLSIDGRRWLLPRPDGGVSAIHVPNTPAEPPGYAKQVLPLNYSTIIGADLKGKRPVALSVSREGQLLLRGSGLALPSEGSSRSVSEALEIGIEAPESMRSDPGALMTFLVTHASAFRFWAWIVDYQQQLWELDLTLDRRYHPDGSPRWHHHSLEVRDRGCRRLHRMSGHAIAWVSDAEQRVMCVPAADEDTVVLSEAQRADCVLGPLIRAGKHHPRFVYPDGDELVAHGFEGPGQEQRLFRPKGRLFGVTMSPSPISKDALILFVGPDRQGIYQQGHGPSARLLLTASDPIAAVRHEPLCERLIWRTEAGERGIYDLRRHAVLRRIAPEAGTGPGTKAKAKEVER